MEENTVIQISNLGKLYRIGAIKKSSSLAQAFLNTLKSPLNNLKHIISLRNLHESDENVHWALKDLNFTVEKGEVLGIIGHNGAGKSTLLKILSRITDPTTGNIKIKGRVSSLLEVGTGFHTELTGRDNIYMNGTILGMSKKEIDEKFNTIVDFSGIGKHLDTPVKFYSSGMKVRLAFSVAAHLEPEILIIDEVLAVGDIEFQNKCLGKMDDVSKSGRTILFVSHDIEAVQSLCSRCIVLSNGEVVFNGNVDQAIEKYTLDLTHSVTHSKLEKRTDRKGNGKIRFTDILVNKGNKIFTGSKLTFDIAYHCIDKIDDLIVSLKIARKQQDVLACINNSFQGIKLKTEVGKGVITIETEAMNLMPATYAIHIWAGDSFMTVDQVENTYLLKVEPADIYKSGKILADRKLGVIIPEKCKWVNTISQSVN